MTVKVYCANCKNELDWTCNSITYDYFVHGCIVCRNRIISSLKDNIKKAISDRVRQFDSVALGVALEKELREAKDEEFRLMQELAEFRF